MQAIFTKSSAARCTPRRPHLVTNAGDTSATFLILQGVGEYDYVPLVKPPQRGKKAHDRA